MTQLNGVIKRRPTVTKEGALSMIINSKLKKNGSENAMGRSSTHRRMRE